MDSYLKAKLVSWRKISVILFTNAPRPENVKVSLFKNEKCLKRETLSRLTSFNSLYIFDMSLDEDYELGAHYRLLVNNFPFANIDVSDAVDFPDFDDRYYYEGDDLGSIYTKEETTFTLWAPLAESVTLKLLSPYDETSLQEMSRESHGIYRIKIKGDLLTYKYQYIVNNNGVVSTANDPYAKGTSFNSKI